MKKIFLLLVTVMLFSSLIACEKSSSHDGEAKTPSSSDVQKGRNYQDVVKEFKNNGFTNIQPTPIYDLITGWLTKDEEVESVSVDGDENYSADEWYPNDVTVLINYHTFSKNEPKENNKTSTPESSNPPNTTSAPKAEKLTVKNCKDLASILSVKAEIDSSYSKFAKKYEDQTIEFDGCITYLTNHGNYDTRYDLLMSAGDYIDKETSNPGPNFKFEDVNCSNLGINDLFLPDFVKIGKNIHITAKVLEFNKNTGIFLLDPVSITKR